MQTQGSRTVSERSVTNDCLYLFRISLGVTHKIKVDCHKLKMNSLKYIGGGTAILNTVTQDDGIMYVNWEESRIYLTAFCNVLTSSADFYLLYL